MAERVKDTIDVKATAEEVFDVAADLEAYPEWNPQIKEVSTTSTSLI